MSVALSGRRISSIVVLVATIVAAAGLFELASVVRLATERAAAECDLVAHTVRRQIDFVAAERPASGLAEIARDPRLATVLADAVAHAPSALFVAVCDTSGRAVAHSLASEDGRIVERHAPLPRARNIADAFRVLWQLREPSELYEAFTPLARNDEPFASIRVVVPRAFLWDSVQSFFWRGVLVAISLIALAAGAAVVLSRVAAGRVRALEAGVAAIREGRFDDRLPETGADEFSRLARELNLLGRQFQAERREQGAGRTVSRAADLLGGGVVVLDAANVVILANAAACRLLGVDPAASAGRRLDQVVPGGHPLHELVARLRDPGERSLSVPLAAREANGATDASDLIAVGHRIADPGGAAAGVLIEIKPAREQAALNALADQTRVLTRLGEMATGVAHELRDPLQSLSLELDAAARAARRDPDEVESQIRSAAQKIGRLDRAISGFLKIARLRPTAIERVRVNDFIAEVHAAMEPDANLAGLEIELDLEPSPPDVAADPQVLRQAVYNLVRNAIQAQPSRNKRIVLRTRRDEVRRGETRDRGEPDEPNRHDAARAWSSIAIADSGPGIPSELRERVLDLFFTTKREGAGVGLALARQAAEMHGGELEIESEVGVGTIVRIKLPALGAAAATAGAAERAPR